jgi:hypothetical protein
MTVTIKNKDLLVAPPSVQRKAGIKAAVRLEFQAAAGVVTITSTRARYKPKIFYLKDLAEGCAKDRIYEFLFCGPPLPITGAVQSPIHLMAVK